MKIEGLPLFVTGAGSGLGRAVAESLHRGGARVALIDIRPEPVRGLADRLGVGAIAVAADICDEADVGRALDVAQARFGGLRAVVNCAGIASSARLLSSQGPHDLALFRRVVEVNLVGTFNVMRLAAERIAANDPDARSGERGLIINTASVAAFDGQKGQAAYAASKAGVAGLSLAVARDLADRAIRCVAIAPGTFETEMLATIPEKGLAALRKSLLFPDRTGRPDEFAMLVRQVIENPYLNGTCLRLDGGARLSA